MTNSINNLQGRLWKWLAISFGSVVLLYGVMRIIPIMQGVVIQAYLPGDLNASNLDSLMLSGKANHARELSINGRDIMMDPNGNFSDELILAPGMNKVEIVALDIRGNSHTKEIILMGKEHLREIKTAQADNAETNVTNTN